MRIGKIRKIKIIIRIICKNTILLKKEFKIKKNIIKILFKTLNNMKNTNQHTDKQYQNMKRRIKSRFQKPKRKLIKKRKHKQGI